MPSVKITMSDHPIQPAKIKNPHKPPVTVVPDPPPVVPTVDLTPASIAITPTTSGPTVGGTVQMSDTVYNAALAPLNVPVDAWHSSNTGVATVNAAGLVTTVAEGIALITATITTPSLTSNTCTMTVKVPEAGTNLSKLDFETMISSGPSLFTGSPNGNTMSNPWASGIDIFTGTIGGRTGSFARYHYVTDGVVQTDDNKALLPQISRGLGQQLWFQGDFYLDAAARMDPSGPNMVQRKLFRFGNDNIGIIPRMQFELTSFGPQFNMIFQPDQVPLPSWTPAAASVYIDTALVALTAGAWHTLRVQLTFNSSFTATDGHAKCWYDNILFFDHPMAFAYPSWVGVYDPAQYHWDDFGVGDQVSAQNAVDEVRYWDNVSFATTQGAL